MSRIIVGAHVSSVVRTRETFEKQADQGSEHSFLHHAERIDLQPGSITIKLERASLAEWLEVHPDNIEANFLVFSAPFQLRRRGVETKLIIGGRKANRDDTLLRNIAKGHRYFEMICAGLSYAKIAEKEGTSKRMVQHLVEFAFLAPEIVEQICDGTQSIGLTTELLKRRKVPVLWSEQRDLIARL